MKKIIFGLVAVMLMFGFSGHALAIDTSIHLSIQTPSDTFYNQNINVVPCDSDNMGGMRTTPYCAILQSGLTSDWNWTWAPSAFLNSINGMAGFTTKDKDNNDVYHYWSWSLNGTEAMVALNQYDLQAGDSISVDFIDPGNEGAVKGGGGLLTGITTEDTINKTVAGSISKTDVLSTPNVLGAQKKVFDEEKAFEFLLSHQRTNGDFGSDLYTDWVALTLPTNPRQSGILKLVKYMVSSKINTGLLTDYERRAMALLALGLNPYNTNGENYIKKIIDTFDGVQFGDKDEDNDDIFALIVLSNSGFRSDESMIIGGLNFVLSKQKENGSFDESVDLTGAAMVALSNFNQNEKVKTAMEKARTFLKQNQKEDGSFAGNVPSTAWAMEGILALGENPKEWVKNGKSPIDYFTQNQDEDGAIKVDGVDNKIWQTSYVLGALSMKTWNQVMQRFEKPVGANVLSMKKYSSSKTSEVLEKNTSGLAIMTPRVELESKDVSETTKKRGWFMNLLLAVLSF
jgi:hypothetical protein